MQALRHPKEDMQPLCLGSNMFVTVVDNYIKIGLYSFGECTSYNITISKGEFEDLQTVCSHVFMRTVKISSKLSVTVKWKWVILSNSQKLALTKSEWTALKACIPYVRKFL